MSITRDKQLEYSEIQHLMFDEEGRRRKASKIVSILSHFVGATDLSGLTLLDVGSSSGIVASEFARQGATVTGVDIDVGGITSAQANHGDEVRFILADSEQLPFEDETFDLVVCNHIYEHVVDDDALLSELRRVVKGDGAMYLGLGNRLGIVEPHYRLPFLSWLPPSAANLYVKLARRGDAYHERFRTWNGLRRLCHGLHVWDYTAAALAQPETFAPGEKVPSVVQRLPSRVLRWTYPLVPTYLWVATVNPSKPKGPTARVGPSHVDLGGR